MGNNVNRTVTDEELERIITALQKNIREMTLRKKIDDSAFTQKQMASELGISEAELSNYVKKPRNMKITQVYKFARYFNVSLDDLLSIGEIEQGNQS